MEGFVFSILLVSIHGFLISRFCQLLGKPDVEGSTHRADPNVGRALDHRRCVEILLGDGKEDQDLMLDMPALSSTPTSPLFW